MKILYAIVPAVGQGVDVRLLQEFEILSTGETVSGLR